MTSARRPATSTSLLVLVVLGLVAVLLTASPSASAPAARQHTQAADGSEQAQEGQGGEDQQDPAREDTPAAAPWRPESTSCPPITDSINRLFLAYFNRNPDGAEFLRWTTSYRSGESNLAQISDRLSGSEEFRTRYGTTSDEHFIEVVYRNVLRREPSAEDRRFWLANLASGYPRGSMMVAFSESEEFVRRTATTAPMAGYLNWYPEGTHWYCGVGGRDQLRIKPLTDRTVYADYLFHNGGEDRSLIGIQTLINTAPHVTVTTGSIPPGLTSYQWGGSFSGDGDYGTALDVQAGPDTSWIVVFYPRSIGSKRLGWQLIP